MCQRRRQKIPPVPVGREHHCYHHNILVSCRQWRREQRHECCTATLGQLNYGYFRSIGASNRSSRRLPPWSTAWTTRSPNHDRPKWVLHALSVLSRQYRLTCTISGQDDCGRIVVSDCHHFDLALCRSKSAEGYRQQSDEDRVQVRLHTSRITLSLCWHVICQHTCLQRLCVVSNFQYGQLPQVGQ